MVRKAITTSAAIGIFLALFAPAGLAATPRQIYQDLANNGRLDGHYSASDLHKAFGNPTVQGYGKPTSSTGHGVKGNGATAIRTTTKKGGVLPFTGMDLTFIAIGAAILVFAGTGLRVLARQS